MDYPHPLVTLKADGTFDYSKAYDRRHRRVGQGRHRLRLPGLPRRHRRAEGAQRRSSTRRGRRTCIYLTNQDIEANPRVDQWSNGTDAAAELKRMMEVRRVGARPLRRERDQARRADGDDGRGAGAALHAITATRWRRRPRCWAASTTSTRCAATAASRSRRASAAEQRAALKALLATLKPSALALPEVMRQAHAAAARRLRHDARAVPALHRA